jgi:hypothetical protein
MCLYERVVQYWVDLIWPARVLGSLRTKPRQPRASSQLCILSVWSATAELEGRAIQLST